MKVFLSHSTKDKDFVAKLADDIRGANIEPWLCEVDVLYGDDFVAEIEKGLKEADLTLLVWSPDAASSAWTGNEWRSVLARETEESRTRLGLVLLRDADFPELLRTKHYIDARSDPAKAIQQTVEWLKRLRDMRRFEGSKAANYILDFEPTDFVGRTNYLEQLHKASVEERGKCLLWGEAGCGKSLLALKFAWRAQGAFDAVVFQHCGQRSTVEIGIELADRIGLDVKELPPDQQITEVKKWLTDRRTLLVLDDIWDLDVKELIPASPFSVQSLSILCTSRQRSLPWVEPPRSFEVISFLEEEAESLFRIYLGDELMNQHRDSLMDLAARVERLPIAVAVVAEMLSKQFGPLDAAAQALKLQELRNEIHDIPELLQHAITSQPKNEQNLLQAMAVCHPDGFYFPLAADISGIDKAESGKARDRLVNSSLVRLVDRDHQRFRLHALLREQLLVSTPLEQLQNKYTKILYELFEDWENRWRECQECLPEVIPAINMLWDKGSIDQVAWLACWGFQTGRRVGELDAALRILKEEEKFWEGREDPDAKDSLQRSYGNQALILQAWGQLEEAMALHKKEEALCIELGNKDGLQICYGNQALILQDWGQLEEAMALQKKQEALCIELGNKDGLQICYGNQALILQDWGQLEEAMALHKKQEALCIELGNKDGLQICYSNQALILQAWGQLEEAMALHKKQEALCIELGNKDGLQASYGNQALILQAWGQLEEAMALQKKQEALCIELGLRSSLGYCYWNWGLLAREQQDRDTEREKLKEALHIFTELNMPRERESVRNELNSVEKSD